MRVHREYLEWAHGPAAEDVPGPSRSLVELPGILPVIPAALLPELRAGAKLWAGDGTDIPPRFRRIAQNILRGDC